MSEQIDYKQYKLGVISSEPDPRDYNIAKLIPQENMLTTFPKSFRIPYNHEIKNQENINSCVWHSFSYICEDLEEKQNGKYIRLSPASGYLNRGVDVSYKDQGFIPREGLKSLIKNGIAPWDTCPVNLEFPQGEDYFLANKESILKNAYKYRITAFAKVETIDEIKNGLINFGMITASIPIYDSFYRLTKQNAVYSPNIESESVHGLHMITIVAWNEDNKWVCLNSWGSGFADGGYFYLPFSFPIKEVYSITDLEKPNYTHDFKFNFTLDKTQISPNSTINLSFSTFDSKIPLGTQTIECNIKYSNSSSNYTYETDSKGLANKTITLNKIGVTKITATWKSPDNKINTKTINVLVEPKQINPIEPKKTYSLSISSNKNTCKKGYVFYITIKTSIPNQLISLKTIRSNGKVYNTTEKTDIKGEFEMGFVEHVAGMFKQEVSWKDGNNEIRSASVNVNIVK